MEKLKKLKEYPWYNNTVTVCIGIFLFVILLKLPDILLLLKEILNLFEPIIIGILLAYIINPISKFYGKFIKFTNKKIKRFICNTLSFITIFLILSFILIFLIPQLIDSITNFISDLPEYSNKIEIQLHKFGAIQLEKHLHNYFSSFEKSTNLLLNLIQNNFTRVINTSLQISKQVINIFIGIILSIYFLVEKNKIIYKIKHFLYKINKKKYKNRIRFFIESNQILEKYLIINLLDGIIVGSINAIIMYLFGLPYIVLISVIVFITNLVPTFGPIIGGILGSLLILSVDIKFALIFIIITIILQIIDGYILKPKLFGNIFNISGLWILICIILSGKLFGLIGVFLGIPIAAITNLSYYYYLKIKNI